MKPPSRCDECGREIGPEEGYAEYELGCLCLDCDVQDESQPDEPDPEDGDSVQDLMDREFYQHHPKD